MIFFTDLDNTLIYSHRHQLPENKVPVEWIGEKTQSFMTQRAYSYFSSLSDLEIIPVTTRSVEQYMRLQNLVTRFGCRYALVCNGAVLIKDGIVDETWARESQRIADGEMTEVLKGSMLLKQYCGADAVKNGSQFVFYAKAEHPQKLSKQISSALDTSQVSIFSDSHKVYCIPASLSKGKAVQRIKSIIAHDYTISAGDGYPDISMLEVTDYAIVHESIAGCIKNEHVIINKDKFFSDGICEALSLLKREMLMW